MFNLAELSLGLQSIFLLFLRLLKFQRAHVWLGKHSTLTVTRAEKMRTAIFVWFWTWTSKVEDLWAEFSPKRSKEWCSSLSFRLCRVPVAHLTQWKFALPTRLSAALLEWRLYHIFGLRNFSTNNFHKKRQTHPHTDRKLSPLTYNIFLTKLHDSVLCSRVRQEPSLILVLMWRLS